MLASRAVAAGALEYRVLGGLAVVREGTAVEVGGGRLRSLLGLLLVRRDRAVSVDELADALWAGSPPRSARTVVQGYVSQLRKLLGPVVVTEPAGYRLVVDDRCVDVARFEGLVAEGRWEEALGEWQGPALADFAFEAWAQEEIRRLEELRLAAQEGSLESRLEAGAHREAAPELEALLAEHPLRETPRRLLMLALYRSGRQAEALEVYQQGRELLVEELGIDPGPELQELQRAILNQDSSLDARRDAGVRSNIPAAASALVGRSDELTDLASLLANPEVRAVTLTGPGGTGKTRLALAAASARIQHEPDGVWFVDLSALREPGLVLPSIARTLGGQEDVGDVLDGKRLLLVLDNFEQLLEASVEVAGLLRKHPGVTVLVTSREPMRIEVEHQYGVEPLPEDDAVELFVQRARALVPSFEPDEHVAEICRRLDRLPLAIQLAAARVKLLGPEAILDRLERRLPFLTQGARDLPDRQRTLRAAIAWSSELLSDEEHSAFEALSVFAGGFTLEAAEEVIGIDLDLLASLVDRSLVRANQSRFALLETIREFAAERMEERGADEFRARHARYYGDLAGRGKTARADQPRWLDELEREHDNLRAALDWSAARGERELNARLAADLGWFWITHGHFDEGRRRLEQALALGPPDEQRFEVLVQLGSITVNGEEFEVAAAACEQAVELARDRGDRDGLGRVLNNLGIVSLYTDRLAEAAAAFEEALSISRESEDQIGVAIGTHNLGEVARARDDLDGARRRFEASLEISRRLENTILCARTLGSLGASLTDTGEIPAAVAALHECLLLSRETNDPLDLADVLENIAQVALVEGDPALAARLLHSAAGLRAEVEAAADPIHARRLVRLTELVRDALDEAAWARAEVDGRALGADAAAAQALSFLETWASVAD